MSIRIVAVLAAAALRVHSVALRVSEGSSQDEPFSEPFDDFYVDEPSERIPESESKADNLMATGVRLGESRGDRPKGTHAKPWAPPPRDGSLPFAGPMSSPHWDNRLLIAPNMKFAFCYIEKNACTQFNMLVNSLNGIKNRGIPFWKSNSDGVYKQYLKTHNVSKADGWSMSIFVREPAERFLSAWLSKCDVWEYGGIDCLGPRITDLPMSEKVEMFERTVVELLPEYMAKSREIGAFNAHYDPQHLFCGGRDINEYDFVGMLAGSPHNINRQVNQMLGVHARVNQRSSPPSAGLFPFRSKAGHGTNTLDLMKKFYQNRTILRMVMEQYAEDYAWVGPDVRAAWLQSAASHREPGPPTPAPEPTPAPTPHLLTRKERAIQAKNGR